MTQSRKEWGMSDKRDDAKQALFAAAGAVDAAVAALRSLPSEMERIGGMIPTEAERLRSELPDQAFRTYRSLAQRGEDLLSGIRRSSSASTASSATREAGRAARTTVTRVKVGGEATGKTAANSARSTSASARTAAAAARRAAKANADAARTAADAVGKDSSRAGGPDTQEA